MNDAARFQGFVLTHLDSLYSYALVLSRHPAEADDLLQDALLRAFEHFATFDAALSFKPWMFTVLKRTHIDRWRRHRARMGPGPLTGDGPPAAPAGDDPLNATPLVPDDILLRREAVEQVREAIRRLPPYLREVVELRDVEGLSYQEIATVMQRPVGTVMSRLYRGRNLLRTYLLELERPAAPPPTIRHGL